MAVKSWLAYWTNCDQIKGHSYICAEEVGTEPSHHSGIYPCVVDITVDGFNTLIGEIEITYVEVPFVPYELAVPEGYEDYGDCGLSDCDPCILSVIYLDGPVTNPSACGDSSVGPTCCVPGGPGGSGGSGGSGGGGGPFDPRGGGGYAI
jgi:hypothetical protein